MPANVYECMFLLDTAKVAGDVPGAAKQLHALLERNHAEVLASRPWEDRKLAYPIKGHKKGQYYLIYFKSEGKNLVGIERDAALSELILRQLVIRVNEKLVDVMLAVARDEHALALQSVTLPDAEDEMAGRGERERGGDEGGEEGRGRRPPRRQMETADKE